MLRIAVCDTAPAKVERLAGYLDIWSHERRITTQLMSFRSGEEIFFEMEISGDFAVVFTGTELSGMNGIETARGIRRLNRLTGIVFIAENTQYLKEMMQVYPAQFVLGNVTRRKVFETMDRFWQERHYLQDDFSFRFNHRSYIIDLWEVLYFASEGRVVEILLETGRRYKVYARLDTVEKNLSSRRICFIRIHQSYLVNSRHIEQYHRRMVRLKNSDVLPVSRKCRKEIVGVYREAVF